MQGRRPPLAGAIIFVIALFAAAIAATPAAAALPRGYDVQRIDIPAPQGPTSLIGNRFGDSVVNGGDVNLDGRDDLLVGIDQSATITGRVFVISGADGSVIHSIAPPDVDAGGDGDTPSAFGTHVASIADTGKCPGGQAGLDCPLDTSEIDAGDGVPDHLATALGVDVDSQGDDMGIVYVLDGATGAVLKRITMPVEDRQFHASVAPGAAQGPGFGRSILSPAGLAACEANGGLGQCDVTDLNDNPIPEAVQIGDIDGGGKPDIVIGASDFTETAGSNSACRDPADPSAGVCSEAGRVYVYLGEFLVGQPPAREASLDIAALHTIKNQLAQHDEPEVNSRIWPESFGHSLAPIGDLGKCNNVAPVRPPGSFCLNTDNTVEPDGKPEFAVSLHHWDGGSLGDMGTVFAIDGETGRVLDRYEHPEPQGTATFGFSNYNQPPIGDVGDNGAPDLYQAAIGQTVTEKAQGRGYVLSGYFRSPDSDSYNFAVLDDPTPAKIGNFGTSSAGVGNVADVEAGLDKRNELLVGAYHAPREAQEVISDVHFFSALNDAALQTIADPDQQPGSGFGRSVAPLGDLNGDGFLDFAVGAGGFDGISSDQGRIYVLRSHNRPVVTSGGGSQPAQGGTAATPAATTPAEVLTGRSLELAASRNRVRRGRQVILRGALETFAGRPACQRNQRVQIQRRRPGVARYASFAQATTDADGDFRLKTKPNRTYFYRAMISQTLRCGGAASARERVDVLSRAAGRSRQR